MDFTTQSGATLSLNLSAWQFPTSYETTIVGETEETYLLVDQAGVQVSFPKDLVEANHLAMTDTGIALTEALHRNYFVNAVLERNAAAFERLWRHFTQVVAHRDLVFSRAEYFLIRHDRLGAGNTISGGFGYCLGGLLEAWFVTRELWMEREGHPSGCYLVSAGGSLMSGMHSATLWSPDTQCFVEGVNDLKPGLYPWLHKLEVVSKRYRTRLDFQYLAIQQLLEEIGVVADGG